MDIMFAYFNQFNYVNSNYLDWLFQKIHDGPFPTLQIFNKTDMLRLTLEVNQSQTALMDHSCGYSITR